MAPAAPYFERFLRAVHRRFVLVRLAESTGTGALAGCLAAAALLPLLAWTGRPALEPAATAVALGAFAGLAWGISHRPSKLTAAMEADRQLDLADLLSTAVSVRGPAVDPWTATVLAVADARCRQHAPSQVTLRRYGSRAWGGVALATAAVLTLAALFAPTADRPAVASGGSAAPAGNQSGNRSLATPELPGRGARAQGPDRAASTPATNDRQLNGDFAGGARPSDPSRQPAPGDRASGGASRAAGTAGQGGGRGTSGERRRPGAVPDGAAPARPRSDNARSDRGAPATGGAPDTGRSPAGDPAAVSGGTTSSTPAAAGRVPPWESPSWPADSESARRAVDAGRVSDAYRDLVRGYFDRP